MRYITPGEAMLRLLPGKFCTCWVALPNDCFAPVHESQLECKCGRVRVRVKVCMQVLNSGFECSLSHDQGGFCHC